MKIKILRRYFEHGTFSDVYIDGEFFSVAVERAWENNVPFKSCIPEGSYKLVPHESPKYGSCYAFEASSLGVTIHGPSQRTHCLIHPANLPTQLAGCLALGERFGVVKNEWAVMSSESAFQRLRALLGNQEHDVEITRA